MGDIKEAIWTCEFESSCSTKRTINYEKCHHCAFLSLGRRSSVLLIYLESCLVDQYGRVEGRRMNEEEITIIKQWITEGFVEFGRISMKAMRKLTGIGKVYTHWVRFSDAAWRIAYKLRRQRSDRMLKKKNTELLSERT